MMLEKAGKFRQLGRGFNPAMVMGLVSINEGKRVGGPTVIFKLHCSS